jgi:light-regulated signal transduction histidine kinase (bacteriophytochrome)
MEVVASMSTRIIHKERLWGLIACHHTTPKYLSFGQCTFFEFISNIVSAKIASLLYRETSTKEDTLLSHYHDILSTLHSWDDIDTAFNETKDQLLLVLEADGIAISREGKRYLAGITPAEEEIAPLIDWLSTRSITTTTQYQALSYHYDAAKDIADTASGLLVLPVQPYEGNYVLAFRPEAVKKVLWGGDPGKVLTFEPNSTKYHPRNSFEIWKEVVRYTAEPWSKEEMDIAEKLRIAIVEFTLKRITEELK